MHIGSRVEFKHDQTLGWIVGQPWGRISWYVRLDSGHKIEVNYSDLVECDQNNT